MKITNKSEFARVVGVSRQTLHKYVKEGMPLDDDDAACAWIASKYGVGGGKNLETSIQKKARDFDREKGVGIEIEDGDIERDDVIGVLARKRKNEKLAWGLLSEAIKERHLGKISAATRHYNQCSDSRLKTEAELVLMQNQEASLAEKGRQIALDAVAEVLRPLRQMLRSLPARMAPRCNPSAVDVARSVLDDEVERIFESTVLKDGQNDQINRPERAIQ